MLFAVVIVQGDNNLPMIFAEGMGRPQNKLLTRPGGSSIYKGDNMSELYHHGIKGQKWGVRRYQNPDGTRTPEGKKRYGDFSKTETMVKKKMTNSYSKFKKEKDDIDIVKGRGGINDSDAKTCLKLANDKFDEYSKIEPKVTSDVVNAVSNSGCTMYGLEYRIKQPNSMAGKIASDAKEKNISFEEAANGIKDTIRYTSISKRDGFVDNYNKIKSNLESKGYEETRCKNYFEQYKNGLVMHKSVQSTFRDKDGNVFELQFQTPSSQAAKELKIPIYEERRKVGISETRAKELENEMRILAEKVKDPDDITKILEHIGTTMSDNYLVHHGILGQKWGVRRFQNIDGTLTNRGKKHLEEMKRQHGEYYKTTHNGSDISTMYDKHNAVTSNYLKKYRINDTRKDYDTISKGTTITRFANSGEKIDGKRKYASITKEDESNYHEMIDMLALDFNKPYAKYVYSAKKDLKVAKGQEVTDYILKTYGNKTIREVYESSKNIDSLLLGQIKSKKDKNMYTALENQQDIYEKFVKNTMKKNVDKIADEFKKKGYDAIVDIEDSGVANYPIILLDPSSSVKKVSEERIRD